MAKKHVLHARAPGRIDFGGGGTDVAPYCVEHHGIVVNAAINYYAYATLVPRKDRQIHLFAQDMGKRESAASLIAMSLDGELDLIKACIKRAKPSRGFELTTYTEIPMGSGLSSSAAIAVLVCAICTQYEKGSFDQAKMAHMAHLAERDDLNHWTGQQDQFAAACGGWNDLEFIGDEVKRVPLLCEQWQHTTASTDRANTSQDPDRIFSPTADTAVAHVERSANHIVAKNDRETLGQSTLRQLEKNLLLVYTGKAHLAGNIHLDILADYKNKNGTVLPGMHGLKEVGHTMRETLRSDDLERFAALLNENWKYHKMLHPSCRTPELDTFMATGLENGALGGKVCGAGGGGCIVFYARDHEKPRLARALQSIGGQILPFSFDTHGVIAW